MDVRQLIKFPVAFYHCNGRRWSSSFVITTSTEDSSINELDFTVTWTLEPVGMLATLTFRIDERLSSGCRADRRRRKYLVVDAGNWRPTNLLSLGHERFICHKALACRPKNQRRHDNTSQYVTHRNTSFTSDRIPQGTT